MKKLTIIVIIMIMVMTAVQVGAETMQTGKLEKISYLSSIHESTWRNSIPTGYNYNYDEKEHEIKLEIYEIEDSEIRAQEFDKLKAIRDEMTSITEAKRLKEKPLNGILSFTFMGIALFLLGVLVNEIVTN